MPSRSPELASTLSFWVPGLGQLYAKRWRRGALVGGASAVVTAFAWEELSPAALWAGRLPESPAQAGVLWALSLSIWLWNIRDASRAACPPRSPR